MKTWIRLHTDLISNRKVQCLALPLFKFWINLLVLSGRDEDGLLPSPVAIAWEVREDIATVEGWIAELIDRRLIDTNTDGLPRKLRPHNWAKRQFEDSSAERMRRLRKRRSDGNVTDHVTESDDNANRHPSVSVSVSGSVSEQKSEEPESTGLARTNGLFWESDESYRRFAGLARQFWPLILPEELARGHGRFWVRFKVAEKLLAISNLEDRVAAGEDSEFVKHMPDYLDIEWKRGPRLRAQAMTADAARPWPKAPVPVRPED